MSSAERSGKDRPHQPAPSEAAWAKRRATISMQIEKAALQLFAEHGVDGVTVEEIATAAGISRRTFYRYFETPDQILTAMPHRSLWRIWQDMHARPLDEPIFEAFLATMRVSKLPEAHVENQRLWMEVMRRSPEAWARAMGRMQPNATEIYRDMIAERLRACGRDPAPAGAFAAAISALLLQACQECKATGKEPISVDVLERVLRSFVSVITDEVRQEVAPTRTRRPAPRKAKSKAN